MVTSAADVVDLIGTIGGASPAAYGPADEVIVDPDGDPESGNPA